MALVVPHQNELQSLLTAATVAAAAEGEEQENAVVTTTTPRTTTTTPNSILMKNGENNDDDHHDTGCGDAMTITTTTMTPTSMVNNHNNSGQVSVVSSSVVNEDDDGLGDDFDDNHYKQQQESSTHKDDESSASLLLSAAAAATTAAAGTSSTSQLPEQQPQQQHPYRSLASLAAAASAYFADEGTAVPLHSNEQDDDADNTAANDGNAAAAADNDEMDLEQKKPQSPSSSSSSSCSTSDENSYVMVENHATVDDDGDNIADADATNGVDDNDQGMVDQQDDNDDTNDMDDTHMSTSTTDDYWDTTPSNPLNDNDDHPENNDDDNNEPECREATAEEEPTSSTMVVDPLFGSDGFTFQDSNNDDNRPLSSSMMSTMSTNNSYEPVTIFGGLDNLGNTCYMASALQMLASLDHFEAELRSTPLPVIEDQPKQDQDNKNEDGRNEDDNTIPTMMTFASSPIIPTPTPPQVVSSDSSALRDALLDVFQKLGNGETFEPDRFKQCVDDRTSLFIGYEQQDAHEFLATLLDKLDEDYKRSDKKETEEKDTHDDSDKNSNHNDSNTVSDDNEDTGMVSDDQIGDNDVDGDSDGTQAETEPILASSGFLSTADETTYTTNIDNEEVDDQEVDDDATESESGTVDAEPCDDSDDELPNNDEDDGDDKTLTGVDDSPLADSAMTETSEPNMISSFKKQRLDESEYEIIDQADTVGRIENSASNQSLSNMEFSDIETLLYSDVSTTSLSLLPSTAMGTAKDTAQIGNDNDMNRKNQSSPKCKLIGGRMDPTDAVLTRYHGADYTTGADSKEGDASQATTASPPTVTGTLNDDDVDEKNQENPTNESTAIETTSPIDENFLTEVRVCLTCDSCNFRRSHKEKYLHLSIEIGDGISSVDDGIRKFFETEELEVKCEKCFHTTSTVTKEIVRLPKALLVHLKRFIVDISPDYTSISYRKNRSAISFDERMPLLRPVSDDNNDDDGDDRMNEGYGGLAEFIAPEVSIEDGSSYALRSVVNHMGSTATFGHYTADAKRLYPQDDDDNTMNSTNQGTQSSTNSTRRWTRFNDSYVSKISAADAVEHNTSTAYLLMFEMESNSVHGTTEEEEERPSDVSIDQVEEEPQGIIVAV